MKARYAILLCIIFLPLVVVQARARSVSLAIGDTLAVTCPGQLSGTIGAQQADLTCGTATTPTSTPTKTPTNTPIPPTQTPTVPQAWLATFDGMPASPLPFAPDDWANTVHSRDRTSWQALPQMDAQHGAACEPPPAMHPISAYQDTVFQCHDHIMTAINGSAGYAAVYLQPPVMADWSSSAATVALDVSTARTTSRDWWDLTITPFADQLAAPLYAWLPDLQGMPPNAIHISMDGAPGNTVFRPSVRVNGVTTWPATADWDYQENHLTPSATTRTPYQLTLTSTHLTFGIPGVVTWVDADVAIPFTRGIVQIGHHSYTPWKDCSLPACGPNTWHWDNLSISSAVPYSVQRVDAGLLDTGTPVAPLPLGASGHLRFMGFGDAIEMSFDGGATWQAAQRQAAELADLGHFATYWQPIPMGATSITLRSLASCWCGDWAARDLYVIGE